MKNIAVVLGNRINNDGSLTKTMYKRLELALKVYEQFNPEYIVLSGGIANEAVNFSEADAMYDYLVKQGIPKEKLIKEGKSLSTNQNAIFTYEILENYDFDNLIIVSTYGHFKDWNALGYFYDNLQKNEKVLNKHIHLMVYTNSEAY